MTITFSPGQFFHPFYGWFDKEPDFNTGRSRGPLIMEPIGEEHRLKPGDELYDTLMASSAYQNMIAGYEARAAEKSDNPGPAYIYEPRDLSYYMDGNNKGIGQYQFVYTGNTMTVRITDNLFAGLETAADVVAKYEEQLRELQEFRRLGYNEEALGMMKRALDEAFTNARCPSLEEHLNTFDSRGNATNTWEQIRAMIKAIFQEYLGIRGSSSNIQDTLITAANNLKRRGILSEGVNPNYDRFSLEAVMSKKFASPELAMKYYEGMQKMNAWAAEQDAKYARPKLDLSMIAKDSSSFWDPAETHIRNIDRMVDFSNNATMSDIEKEARSMSVVFRVRGEQMVDYAKRYEEISGQLDAKLQNGEITQEHYERYCADLNTAFCRTYNLNIIGQATAAGLSDEKAQELAVTFSLEYIKIHNQTAPEARNADKMANEALRKIAAQGWPEFSLYTTENRAKVDANDDWYSLLDEDALYYQNKEQPYYMW